MTPKRRVKPWLVSIAVGAVGSAAGSEAGVVKPMVSGVDHVVSYRKLRASNVLGTAEVLKLAVEGKIKVHAAPQPSNPRPHEPARAWSPRLIAWSAG